MITNNELNFSNDVNESSIQFIDIFQIEEIQRIQDLFSDATGVASIITLPDGTPITKPSNFCRLCNDIIRNTEKGCINCFKSDAFIGSHSITGPTVQPCLSGGLWDAGASITIDNHHIANWLIGQVRTDEATEQQMIDYAEEIGADKDEFLKALNEVPFMSVERFKKVAEMLFNYANELSDRIYKNIQLKKQIAEHKIVNDLLHKSEESLAITLHSIGDGVISTDKTGAIVKMNPVAENMCGWEFSEALGKQLSEVFDIVNSETRKRIENPVKKVLESGKIIGLANHTVLISKNGTEYHIADSAAPIETIEGEITGVVLVFSDITEKYKAEEKLQNERLLLRTLIDNIPDLIYTKDLDSRKTLANRAEVNLLGATSEAEVLGKNDFDHYPEDFAQRGLKYDQQVIQTGKPLLGNEGYVFDKQGNKHCMLFSKLPMYDINDNIVGLIGIGHDITKHKLLEEALIENENFLKETQIIAQLGTYTFDIVNDKWESSEVLNTILGIEPEFSKTFESWASIIHPEFQEVMSDYFMQEVVGKNIRFDKEYKILRKSDKTERWVHGLGQLVFNEKNEPVKMIGTILDITAQKQAEELLRKSEEKFHEYIEFAPHGVFVSDESGKYIEINSASSKITGYSREELLEINPIDLISPHSRETFVNHFNSAKEKGFAKDEFELVRKDNTKACIAVDTVKLSEQLYLGFVVDITYRKGIEKELKANEAFLNETQAIAQLGNCIVDLTGKTWKSSEIMDSIFGIEKNFEKSFRSITSIIHPDWREKVHDYFKQEVLGKTTKFNTKFKIIRQIDQEERWVHAIGESKMDAGNNPSKLIITIQDITERKKAAESLRESDALHRSILNASPDAIIVVEMDGRIRMVSRAALPLYGCEKEDALVGRNMFEFIVPEDLERANANDKLMFGGYMGTIEYRIIRLNGTPFFAEVNGDIIWSTKGEPIGMVFIVRDVSDRKQAEVNLKNSQTQLKNFAAHLQSVREEERVLLAREIHDELGQILIAIKIDLGMLKQITLKSIKTTDAENILTNFDNLFGLVDNTIKTTRKIMTDLRPEVLYMLGFIEAVKLQTNKFQERHGINCYFDNSMQSLELNTQQSVALFRILQESLTNVARHSKATSVKVVLKKEEDELIFEIKDNGIGFTENHKTKRDSYGLIGMKERVFLLGGELLIASHPDSGTSIKVKVPYSEVRSIASIGLSVEENTVQPL